MALNIVMVGSGYVGLVSGACLADFGHNVVCVDIDEEKIQRLARGDIPIYEPGLTEMVASNASAGRIRFTTDLDLAVSKADVVFIAVGTPSRRGEGYADLSYVFAASKSIASAIRGYTVIVTKSTVPVGTGDEVERVMLATNPGADFSVVSNPEFLREGAAIDDFRRPDRVVIGTTEQKAIEVMEAVYRPLSLNQAPLMFTERRTAELIKYAGNAFLAMKITFINEIADLCERVGANVQSVARGIGLDNRIGSKFLNAGPGYGGSCFPKDTIAIVKTAQDYGSPLRLVETTIDINGKRKQAMVEKVIASCGGDVQGMRICILGLTFKPETDDMRDSPAAHIVEGLLNAGAKITAYDPEGMEQAKLILENIDFASNAYEALSMASCAVLITEWNEFRSLDLDRVRDIMTVPRLVDLRNVYRRAEVEAAGIEYTNIGTGAVTEMSSASVAL